MHKTYRRGEYLAFLTVKVSKFIIARIDRFSTQKQIELRPWGVRQSVILPTFVRPINSMMRKVVSRLIIYLFCCSSLLAQQPDWVILDSIAVTGNAKTKVRVILREMPFKVGDTLLLATLPDKLLEAESRLMNTGLFNSAELSYLNWHGESNRMSLQVQLAETWYIYPLPTFELADRSFNVWWREQGRSIERVNIGMRFRHKNFTGLGDELSGGFEYGYTRSLNAGYSIPYLNKKQTLGMGFKLEQKRNREVNYATQDNEQLFFRNEDAFIHKRLKLSTVFTWRPRLYGNHNFYVEYFNNQVDTAISQRLNPDYYANAGNKQRFFRLLYTFSYDFRDNQDYPWKGYNVGGSLEKDGLGIFNERNALTMKLFGERHQPLGRRWSLGLGMRAKYSLLRTQQAYPDNRALGFGRERVSGYEFAIMDGLDMLLLRQSLRFEIWRGEIVFGKIVFLEAFRRLPLRLNLGLANDWAYANDPFNARPNPLTNRGLWGGSFGVDLILYFDYVFRFQYSYNQFGDAGFLMNFNVGF